MAQAPTLSTQRCGFDKHLMEYLDNPDHMTKYLDFIQETRGVPCEPHIPSTMLTINIPCVAHIYNDGTSPAFGLQQVQNIINATNIALDAALLNKNLDINLFLATDCSSNGVFFVNVPLAKHDGTGFGNGVLMQKMSFLPNNKYLNIWFFDGVTEGSAFVFGPLIGDGGNNTSPLDGIISQKNITGIDIAHEFGHYLGLEHVWGKNVDGSNPCHDPMDDTKGDGICDTNPCTGNVEGDCNDLSIFEPFECFGLPYPKDNIMSYSNCGDVFTKKQVEVMVNVLRRSDKWGRKDLVDNGNLLVNGIAKVLIPPIQSNTTITSTTFASGTNVKIDGNIIVENGILTINSDVVLAFQPGASLIIKPGATVQLNGKLANACSLRWEGVQVWTPSAPDPNPNYGAGKLYCNSGSTIEQANTGVKLYKPGTPYGGGMIFANGANFHNNRLAIDFAPQKNFYATSVAPYNSWFNNCSFLTDNRYLYQGTDASRFQGFIKIVQSNWINISNQTKFTINSLFPIEQIEQGGYGIWSVDAGQNISNCRFDGLTYGIKLNNIANNTLYGNVISNSKFYDCFYGVYNSGLSGAKLYSNKFYLRGLRSWTGKLWTGGQTVLQHGIHFSSVVDDFIVEGNLFEKGNPFSNIPATTLGSVFKGHGSSTNTIVNHNTYTDCDIAIRADADDLSTTPNNKTLGLKLYCNDLNSPRGIFVAPLNDIFAIQGQIIGVDQNGNDVYGSAGNKFPATATYHLRTRTNPLLTYYGRNQNMELPTIIQLIPAANIINTGNAGVCPFITDDNGFTVSGGGAATYRQAFAQASANWSSTKQLLQTIPSQTAEYKQLETKLYEYRNVMDIKGNAILKYFKQENKTDSVLVWLKKLESPTAYLQIAFYHLSNEDAIKAMQTINEMITHFDFTAAEIAEYSELNEMFDQFSNDLCYTMLSQTRLDYIYQHFATGKCDLARTMARNVLELYGYTFAHEHLLPEDIIDGKIESNHKAKNYTEAVLVYPNPAKEFTNFSWKTVDIEGENILISIKDMNGRIISSENTSKFSGTYEWHTNNVSNGLYFYDVRLENGVSLQSGKIIIQK